MIRTLLITALAAGQAHASSILVLPPHDEALSPSIVAVGPVEAKSAPVNDGTSAFTTGESAVTGETTAGVGDEPRLRFDTLPLRGTIFGDILRDEPSAPPSGSVTTPE